MKLPAELQEALSATEVCIGNPFRVARNDWEEASAFFDKTQASVAVMSTEFCERRLPDASRRLLSRFPLRERPEDIEPIARGIIRRRYENAAADALAEAENLVLDRPAASGQKIEGLTEHRAMATAAASPRQLLTAIRSRVPPQHGNSG